MSVVLMGMTRMMVPSTTVEMNMEAPIKALVCGRAEESNTCVTTCEIDLMLALQLVPLAFS